MNNTNSSSAALARAIGTWGLAAAIFNCTVGGGIFRLPGAVYSQSGSWTPMVLIVCSAIMLVVALCFTELGKRTTRSGGPYAYIGDIFGPYWGFVSGILIWFLDTVAIAGVATALVASIGGLVPALAGPQARVALLAGIFLVLGWVNARGVHRGSGLVVIVTIVKLIPLLLLLAVGATWISAGTVMPQTSFEPLSFARACMLMLFAYFGVESALIPSGEIVNPQKTVPKAIWLGLSGVTLLYLGLQVGAQAVLGDKLLDPAVIQMPLAAMGEALFGPFGKQLVLIGAVVSMFGFVAAMTLVAPRILYALAEDGFLPKRVAHVDSKSQTPLIAIIIQVFLVFVLAVTSTFEQMAIIANLAAVLLYLLCVLGALKVRLSGLPAGSGLVMRLRVCAAPLIGSALMLWLLTSITMKEWMVCVGVVAVGSIGYKMRAKR